MTDVVQGTFQFHAADLAFAGNEAGRIVTGSEHDFVVAEAKR